MCESGVVTGCALSRVGTEGTHRESVEGREKVRRAAAQRL